MARIRANYETSVKRGSLAQDEMDQRLARIQPVAELSTIIADCDVVIEAVFEQIPVKEEVFKKLDAGHEARARCSYSNTSGIDIDIMANVDQAAAGRRRHAFLRPGQCHEAVRGRAGHEERARRDRDRDGARPQDRQGQRAGRQ